MHLKKTVLLLLLPLALSACDSGQPTYSASNAASAPPPPTPQAQAQPQPQTPPPSAPAAAPPAAEPTAHPAAESVAPARSMPDHRGPPIPPIESFNVATCEDYIARYRTCMNSVLGRGTIPNAKRFPLLRRLNSQVRQWRAEVKADKTADLASQCTAADKEARPILHEAGCTSF